jgi:hypothetical protein
MTFTAETAEDAKNTVSGEESQRFSANSALSAV